MRPCVNANIVRRQGHNALGRKAQVSLRPRPYLPAILMKLYLRGYLNRVQPVEGDRFDTTQIADRGSAYVLASAIPRTNLPNWQLMKLLCRLGSIASLLAALVVVYAAYIWETDNLHIVYNGQLYRSAQPSTAVLDELIRKFGIKTVINLRGPSPTERWYVEELSATAQAGAVHLDIPLSAVRAPSSDLVRHIVDVLNSATKPILVHCSGGADRSGLVSALYLFAIAHQPQDVAARQLSILYGHVPFLNPRTAAMDRSFRAFAEENPPLHLLPKVAATGVQVDATKCCGPREEPGISISQ